MINPTETAVIPSSALMAAGLSFLNESKAADAYAAFRLGLNLSPDDPAYHAALARSALLLSAPHLAQYHAQAALAKNAQNLDAIVILAEAARRLGNRDLCQEQMDKFAKIPSVQHMHRSLELNLALEDGEFEVALHGIATLLEDDPEDMMLKSLFNKGFDLFAALPDRPRFDDFMESLGLAVSKEPTTPPPPRAIAPPHCMDVIIPVYNALEDLMNCLASIEENRTISLGKIILVDDFSDPATATWLDRVAARNPDIVLVRNLENQGFTRSVMKGMTYSHSAFPVLLNSDTRVTRWWLEGLWKAMNRRPTTALVGPLSDNGYYQTIMANVIASTRTLARLGAESKQIDHAASMVLLKTRQRYPRVPLLSGFCLMIRREAYDAVGGFDAEAFPEGYWEVQDLGFKLIDHGLDLVIADDVFVHHSGSASITSERKKRLLHQGRAKMYQRYSALRLLVAEAIAAREPEIAYHRRAWSNYNQFISPPAQAQSKDEPVETRPRRPCRILNQPNPDLRGREVCLFVVHAPMGSASDYTLAYLNAVRAENVYVILCLIVEDLEIPVDPTLYKASDALMMRLNGGYDFAAWADMLVTCPQAWSADRLYFVNDSLTGPFTSLAPIFQKIRAENAGFFALSEAVYPEYHAQSYFFGWARTNLKAQALHNFWNDIRVYPSKADVIHHYEHGISPLSPDLPDPSRQIVFGMKALFGLDATSISGINATHQAWQRMLDIGFPFIKTDLIRDHTPNGVRIKGWEDACIAMGADLEGIRLHLETSQMNRVNRTWPMAVLANQTDVSENDQAKSAHSANERRRVYFHIGLSKTGSSAIQAFLSRNASQLEALGVFYPFVENSYNPEASHWIGNLTHAMLRRAREFGDEALGITAMTEHHFAPVVETALKASDLGTVLLSGEFMTQHLTSDNIKFLKSISDQYDVSLIAFVRDVYDHTMSSWKQGVKENGSRISFSDFVAPALADGQSDMYHLKFISQTGIDLEIINYDHHKGQLVARFLQAIGIDPSSPGLHYDSMNIVNHSLSYWQSSSIVASHALTGSTYFSSMLLNKFRTSPDLRGDPVLTDLDKFVLDRLSAEIAWVN